MTSTTTTAVPAPLSRDATGRLLGQTMGLVAVTAGVFALGAYLARDMAGGWAWLFFIASFAALFGIQGGGASGRNSSPSGCSSPSACCSGSRPRRRSTTTSTRTRRSCGRRAGRPRCSSRAAAPPATRSGATCRSLARFFFWALVALIGFGIVLVFVNIPNGSLIYAIAGLVIFAGLTIFDFQRLRSSSDIRSAPLFAASIFLDVLNVFLFFLTIFGRNE